MTELHIASVPQMIMLQQACETLVMHNHILLAHEYNLQQRRTLLDTAAQAEQMADHLRTLITNTTADV